MQDTVFNLTAGILVRVAKLLAQLAEHSKLQTQTAALSSCLGALLFTHFISGRLMCSTSCLTDVQELVAVDDQGSREQRALVTSYMHHLLPVLLLDQREEQLQEVATCLGTSLASACFLSCHTLCHQDVACLALYCKADTFDAGSVGA